VDTGLISQAVNHLRNGDRISARLLLEEALRLNPGDEQAWLWMSGAVETDTERLDCLRQVLAIDPENQAAREGIQALSKDTRQPGLVPEDVSLETFLQEQEDRLSISPAPGAKKAAKQAVFTGEKSPPPIRRKPDLARTVKPSHLNIGELRNAGMDRGLEWSKPGLSLALPLSQERYFGLSRVLERRSRSRKQQVKNKKDDVIPWRQISLNSTQVTYFVLGLVIAFLLMLIGFSVLKTLVQGPRYKAGAPIAAPPLPSPSPIPEPTSLAFNPSFVQSDCRFRIPPDAHVECYSMILPENRDGTSARSIRIPVVIYRSLNPFPPPDPIVYLHGRGGAIDWAAENFENFLLPLLYQRDVIVLEPRGSGQSTPNLDCPELNNQYLMDLRNDPNESGSTYALVATLQACRDRLASQGIRFANFTTAALAADIADTAALLEFEQINLYGISYGGSVAQTVMREYPYLVRSVVFDSALPLEVKAYNSISSSADYALHQLFEACETSSTCRSAYPNLEAVFNEVKAKLNDDPVLVPSTSAGSATGVKMMIDGTRFQQAILQALYSTVLIPEIPKGIYSARYGDTTFLETALASPHMHLFEPSVGGMLSQNCSDQVYATSPLELEADIEAFPDISAYIRNSIFGSPDSLFEVCEIWNGVPAQGSEKELLFSAIPSLIFNGQLDPVAPVYLGEQLASHLAQASLAVFQGLGHAPSTAPGQECPLTLATAFFYDPNSDFDPTCGLEMGIAFSGR
jgi:pimeloyl-ACP methyl ester carboxylesterase